MRKIFELTTCFAIGSTIGVVLGQLIINKMTTKSILVNPDEIAKIMKYMK
jgi:hypothetical protein